jgi:APA family basic amino acid/polyamine antiporter
VPGYPWVPALYVALTATVGVNLLFTRTTYSSLGLLIVLLGVPVYFLWRKIGVRVGTPGSGTES